MFEKELKKFLLSDFSLYARFSKAIEYRDSKYNFNQNQEKLIISFLALILDSVEVYVKEDKKEDYHLLDFKRMNEHNAQLIINFFKAVEDDLNIYRVETYEMKQLRTFLENYDDSIPYYIQKLPKSMGVSVDSDFEWIANGLIYYINHLEV